MAEPQFRRHDVPSPARARIATMLRALPAARDQTLEQKRAGIDAVATHGLDALGVERHWQELPVAAEWLLVRRREHDMVTVYLH
ncbi:MAG TPA: hypothetical protein VGN51_19225, partial [Acidimicrobiia bacterium]